jgi:hypothetical protein
MTISSITAEEKVCTSSGSGVKLILFWPKRPKFKYFRCANRLHLCSACRLQYFSHRLCTIPEKAFKRLSLFRCNSVGCNEALDSRSLVPLRETTQITS